MSTYSFVRPALQPQCMPASVCGSMPWLEVARPLIAVLLHSMLTVQHEHSAWSQQVGRQATAGVCHLPYFTGIRQLVLILTDKYATSPPATTLPPPPPSCCRNWVSLLKGFATCKTRSVAACSGLCTMMPGKGCTLAPAARKGFIGTLGPRFAACTKLAPAACKANPECAVRS
jgi:hypothetical protein